MTTKYPPLTMVTLVLAIANAHACSCKLPGKLSESQQIDQEFRNAKAVFVAKVLSVKQTPVDLTGQYIDEDATFAISETFKGPVKVGETVQIKSHIGPGACGRAARNSPSWLEVSERGKPSKAAIFSDEWLIYAHGSEPYELSNCDRSFPMNLRGGADARHLRKRQR